MNILKHQKGISLVEVLVALVISLFLLGGIIQVYLGNKASYTFTNAISRVQENGRFAMETLAKDLRMAGFFGCAIFDPGDTSNIVNNLNPAGPGYDDYYDWLGDGLLQGTDNDGLNGSDSITIRGAKPGALNVREPYNVTTSAQIFVDSTETLEDNDIVMVTNCRGADIFQVTNTTRGSGSTKDAVVHSTGAVEEGPGNYNPDNCKGANAHCLSQTYGSDASMIELQAVIYTIKAGASGEPALFRAINGVDEELIDGIEQMQILYGVDTDDDDFPNQYVIAPNVVDMNDVMAVRVMLLVRSQDVNVTEDFQKYTFNDTTDITATDRRLRQVFTSTITLRNRVGGAL
jgi:type IV pilus assembly protein PilW